MRIAKLSLALAVLLFLFRMALATLFPVVMEVGAETMPRPRVVREGEGLGSKSFSNGMLSLMIQEARRNSRSEFWIKEVQLKISKGWLTVLHGIDGKEFSTSLGGTNATRCPACLAATVWLRSKRGWRIRDGQRKDRGITDDHYRQGSLEGC